MRALRYGAAAGELVRVACYKGEFGEGWWERGTGFLVVRRSRSKKNG